MNAARKCISLRMGKGRLTVSQSLLCAALLVLYALGWQGVAPAAAESAVVRAVLFYSPSCPHCHQVIEEVLPPLFERYGVQLQLVGIDTTTQGGGALFQAAVERYAIPPERQAVPMLIVGETILLGSGEIPNQFPGLVDFYLAQGGMDWPDIPGLCEAMATAQPDPTATQPPTLTPAELAASTPWSATGSAAATLTPAASPTSEALVLPSPTVLSGGLILPNQATPGIGERLGRDPAGNVLAIIVLVGLINELGLAFNAFRMDAPVMPEAKPPYAILALCLLGMGVAAYLAYVETAQVQAVCGPVGDCNTVQQSKYARLFGFLPIGVLGLAGYLALSVAWLVGRFGSRRLARLANLALLGMALFSVAFSIYLTFLEPFVIGATCAWCLSSALIMGAILWLSLAPAKPALFYFTYGVKHAKRKRGYRNSLH